jgi:UDP-N-acetylglucosamine 4,6-dehydratase
MLNGKSILITGGTGSFGRAFVRAVLADYTPARLIVFSRDELKQSEMEREFPSTEDSPMRYFIGDVRDLPRLRRAMTRVDYVIHAAAMKQVPACEYNPFEAVRTNILGSQNVVFAAIDCGVQKVIALSSDKAVEPVNLYGATKLVAEKLFIQGNVYAGRLGTRFSCVRYGNVVGSRGSVIPLFLEQRKAGTLTITDNRMTRFWITLHRAVSFVIERLGDMAGGEIFVPKIPSMYIVDLAEAIAPDAKLKIVGVRPGEKLHEVLISRNESHYTSGLDDMFIVRPNQKTAHCSFKYTSNENDHWLSVEDLRQMIEGE